jgi:hypothetical protein
MVTRRSSTMTSLVRLRRADHEVSQRRAEARDEKDGQVGAYCCLVLVVEALIDVLVHQRRLADAARVDAAKMSVSACTATGVLPEMTRSSRYVPTVAKNDNLGE